MTPIKGDQFGESHPNCTIVICGLSMTDPDCKDHGGDLNIPGGAFNILHEMMHCCGIGHGTKGIPDSQAPDSKECNDIIACCFYRTYIDPPTGSKATYPCDRHLPPRRKRN